MLSVRSLVGFIFVPIERRLAASLAVVLAQDEDFLLKNDDKCLIIDDLMCIAPP